MLKIKLGRYLVEHRNENNVVLALVQKVKDTNSKFFGEERPITIGYFTRFEHALNALIDINVREGEDVDSLQAVLDKLDEVKDEILKQIDKH